MTMYVTIGVPELIFPHEHIHSLRSARIVYF
jgi:hypothetical protein